MNGRGGTVHGCVLIGSWLCLDRFWHAKDGHCTAWAALYRFGGGGRVESVSPGAGIATVTGLGYIGFIVGPPAIGFVSQVFTLRYALGLVVFCCIIASLLSAFIPQGSSEQAAVTEAHA